MKIIHTVEEMKEESLQLKQSSRSIGLVPTMGALHEGHLSLARESVKTMDVTVASLFVNPAQFAPLEDFDRYPRDYDRDIYPPDYKTYVEVIDMQNKLCGLTRPAFFRGVCTVVLKLFNIVHPDVAFFGQKDAQQGIIIKRMVEDLNLESRQHYLRLTNLICMNLVKSFFCLPGTDNTSTRSSACFWVINVFCTIGFPFGSLASVAQRTVFDSLSYSPVMRAA